MMLLLSAGTGSSAAGPENAGKLAVARLKIVGQSFIGPRFAKKLILRYDGSGYFLRYRCDARKGFGDRCGCTRVNTRVRDLQVGRFLRVAGRLKDQGRRAKCCDHAWTEMELAYRDGSSISVAVPFMPVEVEEIFDLCGSK